VLAQQGYGTQGCGDQSEWQKAEKGTGTPKSDTPVRASVLWNCGLNVSVRMERIKSK